MYQRWMTSNPMLPNDAFQQDYTTDFVPLDVEDPIAVQFTRNDIDPENIPSHVVLQSNNQ